MDSISRCRITIRNIEEKLKQNGFNYITVKLEEEIICKILTNPFYSNNNCIMKGKCLSYQEDSNCCKTVKCPIHNNNSRGKYNHLFRIRPSDTYNAIVLHAIMLNGSHSDFKMSFPLNAINDKCVEEVMETIQFLL